MGDGIAIGAVEVDEPEFWDYSCGLSLNGFQVALAEPAVDGVIGVAGGGDDLLDCERIGIVSNSCSSHGRKPTGREEGNPVLRGRDFCVFPYFAVENSACGVTYFSGCFAESSM